MTEHHRQRWIAIIELLTALVTLAAAILAAIL